ncbi:hypothetical protein [Limnoglobus roseus]|uniref:Uncharacterized protein n=1 Tax=Limnoglobus roseus TaxID=2598579 RepID=A0A5C1AQU5_9BACT|nr:hypothetical protein [Limnoglobus roseus]QEL19564.1 hypothetical protein PX52LOC_06640 [Limnoglobus roseus]
MKRKNDAFDYVANRKKIRSGASDFITASVGAAYTEAAVGSLARRSLLPGSTSRPGNEGQKSVAARIAAMRDESTEAAFQQDDDFQRFLRRTNNPDLLQGRSKKFAAGGVVPSVGNGDTSPPCSRPASSS